MPELPEVETTLKGISPYIIGQKVSNVKLRQLRLRWDLPRGLPALLIGKNLNQITRRGKYLLFAFDNGTIILHLGMSGRLRILEANTPAQKHDHVDIIFANQLCLRFTDPRRFGALLWTKDNPHNHVLLKIIGPEPLAKAFNANYLLTKAGKRKIAIKSFIMDSKIVAGVGNIYATEALFEAKLLPQKAAGSLTFADCQALVKAIKSVLTRAIKKGGTTLKDFTQSDGQPGYFAIELKVYGKENQSCPKCQSKLKSIRIANRQSVYCKKCQK